MAEFQDTTCQWTTTVIVSTSLQNHEASRMLSLQRHRIRFSDGVESGTFIYPSSGVAFLLVEPQDFPEPCEKLGLAERVEKFLQIHRNSFLLLYSPFNGKRGPQSLSFLQHRFFGSNLRILPVRNNAEIVRGMLTIAKATSKPHVDQIRDRLALARTHIIESSSVWEMLRQIL